MNVPRFAPGTAANLQFHLSDVGIASSATPVFLSDMCADPTARASLAPACAGPTPPKLAGVAVVPFGATPPAHLSFIADDNPDSEQKVVSGGAIAVSVIEGTHEAPRATRQRIAAKLHKALELDRH